MTDNIRGLYKRMNQNTKEEALVCLKKEYNVQSRKLVKNEWIKAGRIPEAYQGRIVELFQNLLRKQQAIKTHWDIHLIQYYFHSLNYRTGNNGGA